MDAIEKAARVLHEIIGWPWAGLPWEDLSDDRQQTMKRNVAAIILAYNS